MDDKKEVLFHGADENFEGQPLVAKDRGDRNVAQLIIDEVRDPESDGDGLFNYCWDDPTIEEDNEHNPDFTAPGFSWKTSYVVDPFDYLELDPPSGSTGVIFASGIYPKDGTPPLGCEIFADTDDMTDDMTDDIGDEGVDAVSGGGCTIAGTSNTSQGALLNLFLIASVLFPVVFLRRRA